MQRSATHMDLYVAYVEDCCTASNVKESTSTHRTSALCVTTRRPYGTRGGPTAADCRPFHSSAPSRAGLPRQMARADSRRRGVVLPHPGQRRRDGSLVARTRCNTLHAAVRVCAGGTFPCARSGQSWPLPSLHRGGVAGQVCQVWPAAPAVRAARGCACAGLLYKATRRALRLRDEGPRKKARPDCSSQQQRRCPPPIGADHAKPKRNKFNLSPMDAWL